jgi:alkylation response protein AidB-like acyl-CoA dehydrogenase
MAMHFEFSEGDKAFRDEIRAFLDSELTTELRRGARATPTVFAEPDLSRKWQAVLNRRGWLGYHWPVEHGGPGWSATQRYIFEKECALAGAPDLPVLSLKLLAPVIHRFGSREQQAALLPRILSGEDYWCQGFSEPGAGSDLASLKTRARRVDDGYRVSGSKLWTTHAQFANHMFCLARTDIDVKAQAGLSFLLIDLRQPGVEIKPIINLAGDHEVNAVFLDDVAVPLHGRVSEEGQGWAIAKFLLENERAGSCHAPGLLASAVAIRATAALLPDGYGGTMLDDATFVATLAEAEFDCLALEMTELRILADLESGHPPGPQTSVVKLAASNIRQMLDSLAMKMFGYDGLQLTRDRPLYADNCAPAIGCKAAQVAPARYLNSRAWTIFGGSNEVQRSIIARSVLGL